MNDHQDWKILISAYFDDELSAEEKDKVNDHLVDCPACQKYLKELESLSLNVKTLKNEPLSPDLEQRINNTRTEGSTMQKTNNFSFLGSVSILIVGVIAVVVAMQSYSQHAIQARIRDAAVYTTTQTAQLGSTAQYEAYYTQSQYNINRDSTDTVSKSKPATAESRKKSGYSNVRTELNYGKDADLALVRPGEKLNTASNSSGLNKNRSVTPLEFKSEGGTVVFGHVPDKILGKAQEQIKPSSSAVPSVLEGRSRQTSRFTGVEGKFDNLGTMTTENGNSRALALKAKMNQKKDLSWSDTATMDGDRRDYFAKEEAKPYAAIYRGGAAGNVNYTTELLSDENGYNFPPQYPYAQAQLQPSNTAQYDRIYENEFQDVTENPLSTFSIDVDTASYSNVRRFLNSNQLPPQDAVRVEEMINYFQYNYPQPGWGKPLSITMEHGLCPWNANHQLVLVGLQAKELTARQTPTSNLVFLIDVSGSMQSNERLPLIKEAFKMMVQQLRPQERISIVVYAGNAGVVLDSASGYDKGLINSALDRLQAGGSTAGGQGIQLAYDMAKKNFIPNGNNRVILATDGDFNVGISDDSQLVRLIEEERKSGIYLTTLGVGTDNLKDSKMQKLADAGNGNYFYLDSLEEAQKVLVDELGSTLIAVAKDVKIQVEFNPAQVRSYRLIGYEKRKLAKEDFNNDAKDAGELGAGHSVTALYEIVPAGAWEAPAGNVDPLKYQKQSPKKPFFGTNNNEIMTVKVRYKEPNSDSSQLMSKILKTPTRTFGQTWFGYSDNLQFASAVAEFGMLLRDSNFKSYASYDNVIQRAQNSAYQDNNGHKSEFIDLVRKAQSIDTRQVPPVPVYQQPVPRYYVPVDTHQGYNQK